MHLIKFLLFLTKYIFFKHSIAINIYCTKYSSYIATTYLLIDYDFIFLVADLFVLAWFLDPSTNSLAPWIDAIDIDITQKTFTKVYRALSQEKRIKRDIRMVPTIKHDFMRQGSQRESFRVVEREYL